MKETGPRKNQSGEGKIKALLFEPNKVFHLFLKKGFGEKVL